MLGPRKHATQLPPTPFFLTSHALIYTLTRDDNLPPPMSFSPYRAAATCRMTRLWPATSNASCHACFSNRTVGHTPSPELGSALAGGSAASVCCGRGRTHRSADLSSALRHVSRTERRGHG